MFKITLIIFLFSSLQVLSQVTLTSSNNPAAGNTEMISDCDTNGVLQGNAGTNQTWNFTSVSRRDSSQISWVSSASTPYSAQFSSSNIASTNDNSNYNYFTTSAVNLLTNGTAGPVNVIPYSNPELFMQYPFTYNSSFSDNFSANYSNGGIPTFRTGTINVTGDAWGTINLPLGSYTNALRVKYIIITKDSSNVGNPFVLTTNLTSYVWFVPGKKFPVFEIIYTTVTFSDGLTGTMKTVNYTTGNVPIGIQQISSEVPSGYKLLQNYPNPFNPSTKIQFSIPPPAKAGQVMEGNRGRTTTLIIYNILGSEIQTLVNENLLPGTYEADWDASNFPSGVYCYRLSSGDFTETRKMILVK